MTASSGSPPGPPRTTATGHPAVPGQKPCPHCGRRIAAQLPVCPFCGARELTPPPVISVDPAPPALHGGDPALRSGDPALRGGDPALRGGDPAPRSGNPAPRSGNTAPAGAVAPPVPFDRDDETSTSGAAPRARTQAPGAGGSARAPGAGPFVPPIERTADQAPLVGATVGTGATRGAAPRTEAFNRFEAEAQAEWPPGPSGAGAPRPTAGLGSTAPAGASPNAPAGASPAGPAAAFDALGRSGATGEARVARGGATAPPARGGGTAPPARADDGLWPPVKRPPPRVLGNPGLGAPQIDRRGRYIWGGLVAVLVAAAVAFVVLRPKRFPLELVVDGPSAVPCDGRRFCVLVYLAPWDPASERSLGTVERLNALFPPEGDVGLAVVIGADEPEARAEFAGRVQAPTYYEVGDGLLAGLDLQRVPAWWLLDARGRITRTVDGTYFPLERHLAALGVRHDATPRRGSP